PTKRSRQARYTAYQRICERFSFRTRRHGQNGRTLHHSLAMSGFVGLSPSRNRKPEGNTLSGSARNLRKECGGRVVGPAVLTAEIRTDGGSCAYEMKTDLVLLGVLLFLVSRAAFWRPASLNESSEQETTWQQRSPLMARKTRSILG